MRSLTTELCAHPFQYPLIVVAVLVVMCCGCYEAPTPPPMVKFDLKADSEPKPDANDEESDEPENETTNNENAVSPAVENPVVEFAVDEDAEPWISRDRLPWIIDYVQYLNGRQIGFSHIEVLPPVNVDQKLQIIRKDTIETMLEGQPGRAEVMLDAIESNAGKLIDLKIETKHRGAATFSEGHINSNRLAMKTKVTPPSTTVVGLKTVNWQEGTWGTLGIQSLLLRQPIIEAGERRSAKVFIPTLMEIAQVELTAGQPELTPLVGGVTPELLPVDVVMRTETSGMRSRNWINSTGEIEKTLALTGPSVTTFRVPRAVTLRLESAIQMEAFMSHSIELGTTETSDIEAMNDLRDRTYSIKTEGRNLDFLRRCPRQDVESSSPYEGEITIRNSPPVSADVGSSSTDEPTDADSQANTWLPSDHPTISNFAAELLGDSTDPHEIASQLTRALADRIQTQELDTRFASVLETIRNRSGDCIDRAILLTTLLRNRQIPARVRSGIWLETTSPASFQYHMWTEAWINEQWQSYDPTSGEQIGVGHIALEHDSLEEENPYNAVVPGLEAFNSIVEIKVVAEDQPLGSKRL